MRVRVRWMNVINMYKTFGGSLKDCFETKRRNESDYNRFVAMNMHASPVYLTRQEAEEGACIAAPYHVSQGSLPSINVTGTDATAFTDIYLGKFTIDADTTIAALAEAIVENNPGWQYYDQLSYFSALQLTDGNGVPYVEGTRARVNLNPTDKRTLWSLAPSYGFSTTSGYLGHGQFVGQGAFCWVHSRRGSDSRVLVSSQSLVANNDLMALYGSTEAMTEAMISYNVSENIFIKPNQQSGGSGNAQQVTVPPSVNVVLMNGEQHLPETPVFAAGGDIEIILVGNNLDQVYTFICTYIAGASGTEELLQEMDVVTQTPTRVTLTATLPAGSYFLAIYNDDVLLAGFTRIPGTRAQMRPSGISRRR